jgi:hypothetical protein
MRAHTATASVLSAESGLTRYLEEIRRSPMLEPEQEYMLATRRTSSSPAICASWPRSP